MMPTLEQLLRVPQVDSTYSFDLSPEGSRLAFSWNRSGAWEIHELSLAHALRGAGVAGNEARSLTQPPGGKFRPRYSPDGKRLAYALDLDGSESHHVAVYDFATGRHSDLTPDITFAHQPNISWSPDGRELAVLSDFSGHFSCYVLPAAGGPAKPVLDVDHPCWDAHWSPAGGRLAVEVEWLGQDRSIFILSLRDGKRLQLQADGKVLNAMHPAWSPDGKTLAFCADSEGWHRLGVYDVSSHVIRWLPGGEAEETRPSWSPDGKRLACIHSRGAESWLRIHDLSVEALADYRLAPGVYAHPRFTRDGNKLLFVFESPRHPPDLWQLDLLKDNFTPLTNSLPHRLDTSDFIIPDEILYPSLDGTLVPALLYRPLAENPPALVNIHGGPNWLFERLWHPLMSHMASQGWTVLAPNYRGSTGYGREWMEANRRRIGEVDTWDCAAGAQFLVREGLADPTRIVVSGASHGGYLTMTCLTEFPELWSGGSAVVPFLNWFTGHANSRPDLQHWDLENLGDPVKDADVWRRRSPYFHLDRIRAGVQLICGANDPRCPASESIAARDRLQELGKPVELILYPDEGHGFLKLENVVDEELNRCRFLEQQVASAHSRAS